MIDLLPNKTFFVQLGIFLFTFICLNFLVFQPVLRILQRRRELTVGSEKEAAEINLKTETLVENYGQKMHEARNQGLLLKDKFKKSGEAESGEILKMARQELEAKLETQRQELSTQSKEAQLVLKKYARDLSTEMAEKLLGRKVAAE